MRAFVLACATFGIAIAAHVACGNPADEATASRVTRLIKQLGDNRFANREAASRDLEAVGEAALDALRKAASSDEAEIRARAERIIAVIVARAGRKELQKWAGEWKGPNGEWMKFTGERWSSGTRTFGPVSGTISVGAVKGKIVQAEMSVDEGPTKGHTVTAIFRLDGDTLHYCGTYTGERPTEFKTVGNYYTCSFQRAKTK